jgi:chromosome segregation ATPase
LRKLNENLNGKLAKLGALEKEAVELRHGKTNLEEQVEKLQAELEATKEEAKSTNEKVDSLSHKLEQVEKDNGNMAEEINDLISKATEHRDEPAALTAALADNAKLTTDIHELQSKVAATDDKSNHEQLRVAHATIATMEKDLVEWTALAKVSQSLERILYTRSRFYTVVEFAEFG